MNTMIDYLYRDADNYKVQNRCVIKGVLTPEQQKTILSCLDEGEYFIPSQVGLPEVKFDEYDEESDHPWFELWTDAFQTTHAEPTVDITSDQLVRAFTQAKGKWDPDVPPFSLPKSLASLIQSATARSEDVKKSSKGMSFQHTPHFDGR